MQMNQSFYSKNNFPFSQLTEDRGHSYFPLVTHAWAEISSPSRSLDVEWGDRWDSRLSLPCFDFREHLALPMPLNEFGERAWSVWNYTEAAPCLITGKEFLCTRLLVDVTLGRWGGTTSHKQIPQCWSHLIRPGPLWESRDHFLPPVESVWRAPGKCLASLEPYAAC